MNQTVQASHHASIAQSSSAGACRIALVQSCWHKEFVDQCRSAFVSEISRLRGTPPVIDFFEVPGAFEIPLQAKLLARRGRYAAIVAPALVASTGTSS